MEFVKVNYHLNQKFYVEKVVFSDIVKNVFKKMKNIKLKNVVVHLDERNNSFDIKIDVVKNKKIKYLSATKSIQQAIEDKTFLLIGSKPKNIEMNFVEA